MMEKLLAMTALRASGRGWYLQVGMCVAMLTGSLLSAADAIPAWRAGTDLRKLFDSQIGLQWKEVPLREGLAGICRDQAFAILLDRRVDPDQRVNFSAKDERLELMLNRLAEQQKLGLASVGSVVYLGPKNTAESLATIAAMRRSEAAQAGVSFAPRIASLKETSWKELATPRELVEQVANEQGLKVANLQAIPHDLWTAGKWPAMNASDRLTLLLAGFDLTFQWTANGQITVVPFPAEPPLLTTTHVLRGDPSKAIAEVQRMFPDAKVVRQGTQIAVTANYETQDKIDRLMRGEQVRNVKVGTPTTRYTLTVDNQPAGAVVATVAKQLSKEAKFSPEVRKKLEKMVSIKVKDATLDELLAAALSPVGLRYKITDEALEVTEAE